HVVPADQKVVVVVVTRVGAKRGGLDDLRAEEHVSEPEPAPDDARISERRLDLVGRSRRGDVEVLGRSSDEEVANTAADKVGLVAGACELADHAIGIGIDRVSVQRRHQTKGALARSRNREQVRDLAPVNPTTAPGVPQAMDTLGRSRSTWQMRMSYIP